MSSAVSLSLPSSLSLSLSLSRTTIIFNYFYFIFIFVQDEKAHEQPPSYLVPSIYNDPLSSHDSWGVTQSQRPLTHMRAKIPPPPRTGAAALNAQYPAERYYNRGMEAAAIWSLNSGARAHGSSAGLNDRHRRLLSLISQG